MLQSKLIFCIIQMQILSIITILKVSHSHLLFEKIATSMQKCLNDCITNFRKNYQTHFSSSTNQYYI